MLLPLVHGILIRSLPESGLLWRTNVVYALTRCVTTTAIRTYRKGVDAKFAHSKTS